MGLVIEISNRKIYFLIRIGMLNLLILALVASPMEILERLFAELLLILLQKLLKDKIMTLN